MNIKFNASKKNRKYSLVITTFDVFVSGKTKLIPWSTGPTDPILSKNKKIILQNFGQLAFLIYYFLLFEKIHK